MSDRGDSTRDWLLKKLLKAKESLVEQAQEIRKLTERLSNVRKDAIEAEGRAERAIDTARRLAERADNLEFENEQLKRVPPIAPNLDVVYHTQRGPVYSCQVLAVSSANGYTRIDVKANPLNSTRTQHAQDADAVG